MRGEEGEGWRRLRGLELREWRDWGRFSGFEGNREKRVRQNQLESYQKRREVDDARSALFGLENIYSERRETNRRQ